MAATVSSNGVLRNLKKKLPFFGVFCYFSVLLNKKFEKKNYYTMLIYNSSASFLCKPFVSSCYRFLTRRSTKIFTNPDKIQKKHKQNKSVITILYHMLKARSGFSAAARRKSRSGASRRSSSFANYCQGISNVW